MNYILRHEGISAPDVKKLHEIISRYKIKVLDDTMMPKMGLVTMEERNLEPVRRELEGMWVISPERKYKVPDTRRKLKK